MRRPIKISLFLAILASIYLTVPWVFGMIAQRYANNFLHNENTTLGKVLGIHLDFAQYNRGWFHSTAILEIEKAADNGDMEIIRKIPIKIDHGPSYRVNNRFLTGLAMVSATNVPLTEKEAAYDLTFHENIGFNGEHGAVVLFSNKSAANSEANLQLDLLELHITSNLKATQFLFQLEGHGLRFHNPERTLSAHIQQLQSTLRATYIGDRHWTLLFGLGLGNNQLSTTLPGSSEAITVNASHIDLQQLHFDTQKIAALLSEVIELKQANADNKPIPPTAWMALLQKLLTQLIQNDTAADIKGLTIHTAMGHLQGHYDVSFPTLPAAHDYFDIATRNVGTLKIVIPSWTYTNPKTNTEFALTDFNYTNYNNTVFSRTSNMTFGAFDIQSAASADSAPATTAATAKKIPMVYAAGFSYAGALEGDVKNLSQTMQWQLGRLCFTNNCFNQIQGKIELLNMNYDAFRGIATATRQVVQYNPHATESMSARWMDLADAYVKLISPKTQVIISHHMMTPKGNIELHGELSWPTVTETAASTPTLENYMDQSDYVLQLLFPASYVTTFLDREKITAAAMAQAKTNMSVISDEKKAAPSFEVQAAQFLQYAIAQGYLKKVGDAYVIDLAGKGKIVTINGVTWKMPGH